jgi:hypothetical protein
MNRLHHRFRSPDPEDLRFRALWSMAALAMGLAVWWAEQQEPVETDVVHIPERILQLVLRDRPAEPKPPSDASAGSGGVGRPIGRAMPEDAVLQLTPEAPFGRVFAQPVYGSEDIEMSRWEEVLAEAAFEDPLSSDGPGGLATLEGGEGREDAVLSGGFPDHVPHEVELAQVSVHNPAHRAALLPKVAPPPPVVSDRAVSVALRSWRRHVEACRALVDVPWTGRVTLVVDVQHGKTHEVEVRGPPGAPADLLMCLQTRARHLLVFDAEAHGEAKLPLVFE